MDAFFTTDQVRQAARWVQARTHHVPTVGVILGSGLAEVADALEPADHMPFREIPHFAVSTVEGHAGELVLGRCGDKTVALLRGRLHYYEGYSMQQVTFPVRVLRELGVRTLIVTNAAGGLNTAFRAGDLMLLTDHLDLAMMAGLNPLRGPNDPQIGPRFPEMTNAYDPELRALAQAAARELGFTLREGVYVMLAGPNFETPADSRFLRLIGADAVGMSTVPEVLVARHGGLRVLGISLVSNVIPETGHGETSHAEVLAAGKEAAPRLAALIREILRRM